MDKKLALETLKTFVDNTDNVIMADAILVLHPELAESEDEKIRKHIIWFLENYREKWDYPITKEDCLAYLEKQKDQKSTEYPICKETEDKSHINWSYLEECPKEDEYEVVEKGDATGLRKKSIESNPDTANFDEGFKTGREVGFREGVESVKPVAWSEEDEKMLTSIIERGSSQVPFGEPALRGDQMEWLMNRLKSLRPQPKQEWSEEDKRNLETIINLIYAGTHMAYGDEVWWLKRLPSRFSLPPKQELCKEDIKTIDLLRDAVAYFITFSNKEYTEKYEMSKNAIPFLAKLKECCFNPQPHWKPSKEQMEQLNSAADLPEFGPMVTTRKQFPDLESLYNELLKNYKL